MLRLTIEKERNIRLDTSDMILSKSSPHSPDCSIPSLVLGSVFHEKTVKVGLDDHSWIRVTIDTDSRTNTVTTDVEHAGVWSKVSRCLIDE